MRKLRDMVSNEVIQRARRILGSVRNLRLNEEACLDVSERVALLTLVSDLRDVAAFGFGEGDNEARLVAVQRELEKHGLRTLITTQIPHEPWERLKESIGDICKVFDLVDEESDSRRTGRLLWVFREARKSDQARLVMERKLESGILLSYPECCVRHHTEIHANFERAFATAIIAAVGTDPVAVEQALRGDLKVEIPGDPTGSRNIRSTDERFPFVLHIACDSCLSSDDSPTAQLNRSYGELVRQYDRRFHQLFLELAKANAEANRLIREAEEKGFEPGNVEEEPLKSQIQRALEQREKLCGRILIS